MKKKINIVAEIGCNHMGKINLAKKFIEKLAYFCNAKYVKFQKRDIKTLFNKKEYNSPHPNPANSFGETYGEHRERLELDINDHKKLKKFSKKLGLTYATSVWDLNSAKQILKLSPSYIKIPSGTNMNFKIYEYLVKKYKGDIHISLGMTDKKEEKEIIKYFRKKNKLHRLILYSCTSGYPVPVDQICLLEIERLIKDNKKKVKAIGFSGHHNGIAVDMAAIALGAEWIERHFTLDRTWKGTDHAASLEPDGMRKLIRNGEEVIKSLSYKNGKILKIEKDQRKKLKKIIKL